MEKSSGDLSNLYKLWAKPTDQVEFISALFLLSWLLLIAADVRSDTEIYDSFNLTVSNVPEGHILLSFVMVILVGLRMITLAKFKVKTLCRNHISMGFFVVWVFIALHMVLSNTITGIGVYSTLACVEAWIYIRYSIIKRARKSDES